jgi:flagella basal body P-ring formation protein FlgA
MRKHRTFNNQHPTPNVSGGARRPFAGGWPLNDLRWMLVVGCSMLIISPAFADETSSALPAATVAATNTALDEAAVTKLLTAVLQEQFTGANGELNLRFTRPWVSQNAPAGLLTLKILEMPTSGVTSAFIVRFEIFTASGASLGNWQMPVQAHVWREVHVARSMLKPGVSVADADIALERRDVLALRAPLAEFVEGDAALEIAESIPAGSPLFARSVKLRPVVRRGELTNARLEEGALSVTMKVQALEDGTPGQIIRLRNLQSARDFSGKVLNEKTVLVSL